MPSPILSHSDVSDCSSSPKPESSCQKRQHWSDGELSQLSEQLKQQNIVIVITMPNSNKLRKPTQIKRRLRAIFDYTFKQLQKFGITQTAYWQLSDLSYHLKQITPNDLEAQIKQYEQNLLEASTRQTVELTESQTKWLNYFASAVLTAKQNSVFAAYFVEKYFEIERIDLIKAMCTAIVLVQLPMSA